MKNNVLFVVDLFLLKYNPSYFSGTLCYSSVLLSMLTPQIDYLKIVIVVQITLLLIFGYGVFVAKSI